MKLVGKLLNFQKTLRQVDTGENLQLSWEKIRALNSLVYSNLDQQHRSAFGVKFEDLVVDCFYKGQTCTEDDFKLYLHPSLINCFTFQPSLFNKTSQALGGPRNGLTLILRSVPNINYQYERLDPMQNIESIRLAVHAPGTVPFMTKNALNLKPGESTSISLMAKTFKRLGSPYTDCNKKDVFQLDSRIFEATRDACREKCMIKEIQQKCNCTSTILEDLTRSDKKYCYNVDNISPLHFEDRNKCEISISRGGGSVACEECYWDCDQYEYDIQTTFSEWPHESKVDHFIQNYVLLQYRGLNHQTRPCNDSVKSFYSLLLQKAQLSKKICAQNNTKDDNLQPFSMMTISNTMSMMGPTPAESFNNIIDKMVGSPEFPNMYEYVMDVPLGFYNIKTLKELHSKWVRESFYHVNIYFRQMSVEQHVQEPSFSFPDLCSSIGGILGLWAGFSVMTIIEIGSFIIKSICIVCSKKKTIASATVDNTVVKI